MQENVAKWVVIPMLLLSVVIGLMLLVYGIMNEDIILILVSTLVLLTVPFVLLIHLHIWKTYHYICPQCSTSFKPTFAKSLTAMNFGEQRVVGCPKCGHYGLTKALKD
ncbi:MAG: hypothetical protein FWG41_03415 [Methanomassiliicoccaceae archaeon]|nr:hypothetical protein [Methanomassiliicoccaceae archaeon]